MAPICSKQRGLEANGTTQTQCNSPVVLPDHFWGHIVHMDDNTNAKRILSTLPPEDWRRPGGSPRIIWLSIVQQDLRSHNLTLPEAVDTAQNKSVEDVVDVRCYAISSCMPETMMITEEVVNEFFLMKFLRVGCLTSNRPLDFHADPDCDVGIGIF